MSGVCDCIVGVGQGCYEEWLVYANEPETLIDERFNFCPRCGRQLVDGADGWYSLRAYTGDHGLSHAMSVDGDLAVGFQASRNYELEIRHRITEC